MANALRTIQVRVKNSAERLDKELPGWHKKINLGRLNMHEMQDCIYGQLDKAGCDMTRVKTYTSHSWSDGPDGDMCIRRGFYLPEYAYNRESELVDSGQRLLTRLWTAQIRKRLAK